MREVLEALLDSGERAAVAEGADVQLVNDQVGERMSRPAAVGPLERERVDHFRRAMHAFRLEAGRGVRQDQSVRERVAIPRPGPETLDQRTERAVVEPLQGGPARRPRVLPDDLDA